MSFYIIPQMRSYPASCQYKRKKSCTQKKYRPRPFFHDDDLDLAMTNFASPNLWHDMLPEFSLSMMDHKKQDCRVSEDDNMYEIVLDVPGVKPTDIKVQLEQSGKVLHVSGERKVRGEGKAGEYAFDRRWTLGNDIDMTGVSANVTDGVLVVTIPKKKVEEKEDEVMNIVVGTVPTQDKDQLAVDKDMEPAVNNEENMKEDD